MNAIQAPHPISNPLRFSGLFFFLAILSVSTQGLSHNLSGKVIDSQGMPIAKATVYIYTAKPRTGTQPTCSHCYPDSEKSATTDASGAYSLNDLDPSLQFRLLTVAEGYRPKYNQFVIPESGPTNIRLTQRNDAAVPRDRKAKGKVTDLLGSPIVGAKVTVVKRIQQPMDPFAITDSKGIFTFVSETPFEPLSLKIQAKHFAPLLVDEVQAGKHWVFQLTQGTSVRGRISMRDKPLPGAKMTLSAQYTEANRYRHHFATTSDRSGNFVFLNIPADTAFDLTGYVEGFSRHVHIDSRPLTTPDELNQIDTGNHIIASGFRLAGRIILENNAPIPDGTRLAVYDEGGAVQQQFDIEESGRFECSNLAKGTYGILVDVEGFRLSISNPNLNRYHGRTLRGELEQDLNGFPILMDRGNSRPSGELKNWKDPKNQSRAFSPLHNSEFPLRFRSNKQ